MLKAVSVRRAAAAVLVLGLVAAGAAYASAFLPGETPAWAGPLLTASAVLVMTATAVVAVARTGSAVLVAAISGGGAALAIAMLALWTILPADPAAPRIVLGLPPAAAYLLYGIGLLPAFVVPLVYALTFDRATLSERDLERLREGLADGRGHTGNGE